MKLLLIFPSLETVFMEEINLHGLMISPETKKIKFLIPIIFSYPVDQKIIQTMNETPPGFNSLMIIRMLCYLFLLLLMIMENGIGHYLKNQTLKIYSNWMFNKQAIWNQKIKLTFSLPQLGIFELWWRWWCHCSRRPEVENCREIKIKNWWRQR